MEEEDFAEMFGFDKPSLDETLVFTCKAGIRSASAAKLAQMAGYTNILDYAGGSNEWFS
jgi:rhodanese-related sulfurtransferase